MKNVFYFILGVCLIILTSATTASVITVKPAKPKSEAKETEAVKLKNGWHWVTLDNKTTVLRQIKK